MRVSAIPLLEGAHRFVLVYKRQRGANRELVLYKLDGNTKCV